MDFGQRLLAEVGNALDVAEDGIIVATALSAGVAGHAAGDEVQNEIRARVLFYRAHGVSVCATSAGCMIGTAVATPVLADASADAIAVAMTAWCLWRSA